jgi:hypothetical protein
MAWSIYKGDRGDIVPFDLCIDLVGTNALGDATMLFGGEFAFADKIKERGLAMIHMTEYGDDWGAGKES